MPEKADKKHIYGERCSTKAGKKHNMGSFIVAVFTLSWMGDLLWSNDTSLIYTAESR